MATQQSGPGKEPLNAALGYISRHLAEKIRLRDLSGAAGVSSRTLGYLFLRTYGVTPMAFVKEQRLTKAHRLLRQADPATTTVASIARSCGFTHMGQFSQDYKRTIGESPSATLLRDRQRGPGLPGEPDPAGQCR